MIVCAVFRHFGYTLTGEVKILLTMDRKEERPQSETITAVKDDIFEFEEGKYFWFMYSDLNLWWFSYPGHGY